MVSCTQKTVSECGILFVRARAHFRSRHLVFVPQQIKAPAVNGRTEEVQAVVRNAEVQVAKPEHRPVRQGWSFFCSFFNPLHDVYFGVCD